jgi:hypothetical protein
MWEVAGLIRRNAEAIIVTTSVTPAVTDDTPAVTEPVDVTGISGPNVDTAFRVIGQASRFHRGTGPGLRIGGLFH